MPCIGAWTSREGVVLPACRAYWPPALLRRWVFPTLRRYVTGGSARFCMLPILQVETTLLCSLMLSKSHGRAFRFCVPHASHMQSAALLGRCPGQD
jgi:hypothetical protein